MVELHITGLRLGNQSKLYCARLARKLLIPIFYKFRL